MLRRQNVFKKHVWQWFLGKPMRVYWAYLFQRYFLAGVAALVRQQGTVCASKIKVHKPSFSSLSISNHSFYFFRFFRHKNIDWLLKPPLENIGSKQYIINFQTHKQCLWLMNASSIFQINSNLIDFNVRQDSKLLSVNINNSISKMHSLVTKKSQLAVIVSEGVLIIVF